MDDKDRVRKGEKENDTGKMDYRQKGRKVKEERVERKINNQEQKILNIYQYFNIILFTRTNSPLISASKFYYKCVPDVVVRGVGEGDGPLILGHPGHHQGSANSAKIDQNQDRGDIAILL